jgi:ATP phosphoribosyltransferase
LKIGLPKGRLLRHSEAARAVAPVGTSSWLLRLQDIPGLVADGSLDAGITSEEWIRESRSDVVRLTPLCWYHIRICAIGHPEHPVGPAPRIVSEYPSLAAEYTTWRHPDATVRHVHGACEAYVPTLADLALDCVETGLSMKKRGLGIVEELFRGDVWLVCSHETAADHRRRAELLAWAGGIRHGETECAWQTEDAHVTA